MREAREKYNVIVSVHINLCDAYENSPLWDEYVERDLLRRNEDGTLHKAAIWDGDQAYHVSKTREWRASLLQQRLDQLLELLPLSELGTLHIDVFNAFPSPFHGTTEEQEYETLRAILLYLRERGVDVTNAEQRPRQSPIVVPPRHLALPGASKYLRIPETTPGAV
jgi:hypothetical protein